MNSFFKSTVCYALAATLVCPSAKSQSGFFITTDASSGNVWTAVALSCVTTGISALFPGITYYDELSDQYYTTGVFGSQVYNDYLAFRENGERVKLPDVWRSCIL